MLRINFGMFSFADLPNVKAVLITVSTFRRASHIRKLEENIEMSAGLPIVWRVKCNVQHSEELCTFGS